MSEDGRWRHVVLPVDQLMPLPVVGKQQKVVVGELHARAGRLHRVFPGHGLIVAGCSGELRAIVAESGQKFPSTPVVPIAETARGCSGGRRVEWVRDSPVT